MAAVLTQSNRPARVTSVLGTDALLFTSMSGSERLSTLYNYRLEVVSEDHQIELNDLIGSNITVELDLPDSTVVSGGAQRFFNGIVADCAHSGAAGRLARYEVTIRPWYWLLTRTSDCRIFQDMKVPDIIKQVFQDAGFSDFDDRLNGSYENWRYCVQYRETDYNFLSRLMEHEGIYFYFRHESGKNTLVLADGYSAHSTFPDYEVVPYYPVDEGQMRDRDHIQNWRIHKSLQPGKYAVRDFNFETPKTDLLAQLSIPGEHSNYSDFEIYDYPGEYPGKQGVPVISTGETLARHRIEEIAAQHETASGEGNAHGLCAGYLFNLSGCGRSDQDREYLIVEASVNLKMNEYASGGSEDTFEFYGAVSVIESQTQFRAPRVTPKPSVQGPQTAIVVGPSGEEIWTDQYGRVKLQFHWDRYGVADENSSCWVRVSQLWAGQGWGAMHIPRIGHEVIVEFLEGDPDRPIVTGRVYNGENSVPYELPANQTQSGVKSRSTKSGGAANFNEIRMEDKKGAEQLYIHAEKNMDTHVENDQTLTVEHDRTKRIMHDETSSIDHDRFKSVGNNQSEDIGKNKSIRVGSNHKETVGSNASITVGSDISVSIGSNSSEQVGDDKDVNVGKNITIQIGDNHTGNVGKDMNISVGKDLDETVGGKYTESVSKEYMLNAKKIQLVAKDEISLKTGKASILLKKNGDITISGKKINVKGSGDIILKGSKIKEN